MIQATNTSQAPGAGLLGANPDGIPQELKERPQWVVWKLEWRDGKLAKVPYNPWTGERASTTDLLTWATFEEALAVYHAGGYDGVGFVFCSADPFVGIDLDGGRDRETGEIKEWAQSVIDKFPDAYVEVSPSGKGMHLIMRGRRRDGKRKGRVEIYGQERFFTVTGVGA